MHCPASRSSSRPVRRRSSGSCRGTYSDGSPRPLKYLGRIPDVVDPSAISECCRELRTLGAFAWAITAASMRLRATRSCLPSSDIGAMSTGLRHILRRSEDRDGCVAAIMGHRSPPRQGPPVRTPPPHAGQYARARARGLAGTHASLAWDEFSSHSPTNRGEFDAWARIRLDPRASSP